MEKKTSSKGKTILDVTFKLAIVAIGICAAYVIYLLAYDQWDMKYGKCGGRTINQKRGIYVQYFANETVRLKNVKTGKWTSPRLLWVGNEPERDSISVFCDKEGMRGFYNTHTGTITLPGQYRHAWYFSDGVAAVVGEDERVRFINYDGSQAVPGSYHYSQGYDYVFKNGLCEIYNDSTATSGILRKEGTWALEPVYSWIEGPYEGGWYITSEKEGYQLWKEDFTLAWDGFYDRITMADDGRGVYVVRNHVKMLLDYDGNVLQPFIIDGTYPLKYMSRYNADEADEYEIIPEVVVYRVDGLEGLMDKRTGKVLTPAEYNDFELISPSLVRAQYDYYDGGSVVMDLRGRIITNP